MSAIQLTSALLVLLATVWSSASAQRLFVLGRGNCPNTGTQANFDPSLYLGTWYEYERFNNWFEAGMKCVRAEYGQNADQSISVLNAGTRTIRILGSRGFEVPASIMGEATIPDPSKPAELKVSFSQFDSSSDPNYFVVDTDYNNYAVVFSCSKLPGLPFNIQFAWILTRARGAEPTNLAQLKSDLQSAGVKTRNFKPVDQSDC